MKMCQLFTPAWKTARPATLVIFVREMSVPSVSNLTHLERKEPPTEELPASDWFVGALPQLLTAMVGASPGPVVLDCVRELWKPEEASQ